MRSPDDQLSNLRKQWQHIEVPGSVGKNIDAELLRMGHKLGAGRTRYVVGQNILIVVALLLATSALHIDYPRWLKIAIGVYMSVATVCSVAISLQLQRVDLSQINVAEAIKVVCHVIRLRARAKILGVAMCVPLLVLLAIESRNIGDASFYGFLVGAVIGTVMAVCFDYRQRRLLQSMRQLLEEMR